MDLDCAGLSARIVLQSTAGPPKSVLKRNRRVLVDGIELLALSHTLDFATFERGMLARGATDDDHLAGNVKLNVHLIRCAAEVMPVGFLDKHSTAGDPIEETLQFCSFRTNELPKRVALRNVLERRLDYRNHVS